MQNNGVSGIGYMHWNGSHWGGWARTTLGAFNLRAELVHHVFQNRSWIGLATNPLKKEFA